MIVHIRQISKGMFDAGFRILDDTGNTIGTCFFTGKPGSREGSWNITIGNDIYHMRRLQRHEEAGFSKG